MMAKDNGLNRAWFISHSPDAACKKPVIRSCDVNLGPQILHLLSPPIVHIQKLPSRVAKFRYLNRSINGFDADGDDLQNISQFEHLHNCLAISDFVDGNSIQCINYCEDCFWRAVARRFRCASAINVLHQIDALVSDIAYCKESGQMIALSTCHIPLTEVISAKNRSYGANSLDPVCPLRLIKIELQSRRCDCCYPRYSEQRVSNDPRFPVVEINCHKAILS